ncbi:MAG TPA: peptide deformylase [Chloroflexota bacterium]|nr:peptide deformylase [Chloroflexota bacterium]
MPVRPIRQLGDPVLRQVAKKVRHVDANIDRLVVDMIDTVLDAPGSGLAAPQIGVPLRVLVTHYEDEIDVWINPELAWRSEETEVHEEGCLSIKGYAGPVERSLGVEVRGLNRKGKKARIRAEDWLARILQHEIDHLNGILYIDHIADKRMIHPADEDVEVEDNDSPDLLDREAADRAPVPAS